MRTSLCLLLSAALLATVALAEPTAKNAPARKSAAQENAKPTLTPVRIAAAVAFAEQHHPELAELLEQLKTANPDTFREAALELHQTHVKIDALSERSKQRGDDALAAWKIDSRIRLLVARISMSQSSALEDELRSLLAEKQALKLAILKRERKRLADRLAKIDGSIAEHEAKSDEAIDRMAEQLMRQAHGRKPKPTKSRSAKE